MEDYRDVLLAGHKEGESPIDERRATLHQHQRHETGDHGFLDRSTGASTKMTETHTITLPTGGRARTLVGWGAGLFASHIVSGYMQEMLFAIRGYTFGFYLTLGRYVINALLAYLYLQVFSWGTFSLCRASSSTSSSSSSSFLSSFPFSFSPNALSSSISSWLLHLQGRGLGWLMASGMDSETTVRLGQRWMWGWARLLGVNRKKTDEREADGRKGDYASGHASEEDISCSDFGGDLEGDGPQRGRSSKVADEAMVMEDHTKTAMEDTTPLSVIVEEGPMAHPDVAGRVPLKYYLLLSFLSVMALGLSTSALAFLNYPTKVPL